MLLLNRQQARHHSPHYTGTLGLIVCIILWPCVLHNVQGEGEISTQSHASQVPGVFKEVSHSCEAGCTARGNCNIEEGRCECPYGYHGPTCQPALRGCQLLDDGPPFMGNFIPRNCECLRQGHKYECDPDLRLCAHEWLAGPHICFELKDKPANQQLSLFSDLESPELIWKRIAPYENDGQATEIDSKEAVDLFSRLHGRLWSRGYGVCSDSCNFHGGCMQENFGAGWNPPRCLCHKGYKGPTCNELDDKCYNNCNGRGTCVLGFCHCQPPWFGMDCSRSKAFEPVNDTVAIPLERRALKIYMYELPPYIAFPISDVDFVTDHDQIYNAYMDFLSLFLQDWAVRTENPWEANLFYIPAMTYEYTGNVRSPADHIKRVLKYVWTTYPYFNRTSGRDHFLLVTGDRGACYAPPEAKNVIKVSHFGLTFNPTKGDPLNFLPMDQEHGCLNPMRDVVMAPHGDLLLPNALQEAHDLYKSYTDNNGSDPERNMLFFFAGGVRHGAPDYSGGARQAVHSTLTGMKNNGTLPEDVMVIEGGVHNYVQLLRTTKFCMVPYGHGWGIRINFAMLHACIPVVIQDKVVQPYEDVIPYEDFSVRLGVKDVPVLVPTLRAIPEHEQMRMRLEMGKYYRAFIWDASQGGEAYNYTLKSLRRKVHHLWSDMYRHQ